MEPTVTKINLLIQQCTKIPGSNTHLISDGHNTFQTLYQYRLLYHALILHTWHKEGLIKVEKSLRYHDGKLCYDGAYFIVVAYLPTGQISNHYPVDNWDIFKIPTVDSISTPYDGHTSEDTLLRLQEFIKKI